MRSYQINKIVGLGLPALFLCTSFIWLSPDDPRLWWGLIVTTHTLGYMHFILGYTYQYQSIQKSIKPGHMKGLFVLTAVAVLTSLWFIATDNVPLLAVIAIGYFIFHGTLNEHTLMERQLGAGPGLSYIAPFVFYIAPFFLLSLSHSSFFFSPDLTFLNPEPVVALRLLGDVISVNILWFLAIMCHALFIIFVPLRLLLERKYRSGFLTLILVISTLIVFYVEQPLNYVILYFISLSYHFISWSLFFGQEFLKHNPARLPKYIKDHIIVLTPFVFLTVLVASGLGSLHPYHQQMFDGRLFLILAMVHNTTSLLNEIWFQRLFLK